MRPLAADIRCAVNDLIHDVEVVQSLVKSKVVNVEAMSVKTKDKPEGKDYISALIQFENGVTANLTASRITQSRVRTLSVTTDENYIDMDFINQSINVCTQSRSPYMSTDLPEWMKYGLKGCEEHLFIPSCQPLASEQTHFVNCILGKETPRITGENALEALKVIWEVQRKLGFLSPSEASKKAV